MKDLLAVDLAGWRNEIADVAANYAKLGDKLPKALNEPSSPTRAAS